MSYHISCTHMISLDGFFSSLDQFVTILAFLLLLSITSYPLGYVSRKQLATYFTFLWFLIDSFSSKKYIGHVVSIAIFPWISDSLCSSFTSKCLSAYLAFVWFLFSNDFSCRKQISIFFNLLLATAQLCTTLAFLWFLSF